MRLRTFLSTVLVVVAAVALAATATAAPRPAAPSIVGPDATAAGKHTYVFQSIERGLAAARLHYRCSLDSATLHACAARTTLRLTAGTHVLRVQAVDPAGRRSPVARLQIDVSAVAPELAPKEAWQHTVTANPIVGLWGTAVGPNGDVYVTDASADQVVVYDANGNELRRFGSAGTGPGQFQFEKDTDPADAALPFASIGVDGRTGDVYVADSQHVEKFDAQGNFELQWGSPGTGNGQFTRIMDIKVDAAGVVYVAEDRPKGLGRVQEFDGSGTFRTTFGRGQIVDTGGIEVAPNGDVIVSDDLANAIHVFGPDGRFEKTIGEPGNLPGQLDFPTGLALDGSKLYVADGDHDRIVRFDLGSGEPTGYWPVSGSPDSLRLDPSGTSLYVVTDHGVLTKYELPG